MTREDIAASIAAKFKEALGLRADTVIGYEQPFSDFGMNSINAAKFSALLSRLYDLELTPGVIVEHFSVEALAGYLLEEAGLDRRATPSSSPQTSAKPATAASDDKKTQEKIELAQKIINEIRKRSSENAGTATQVTANTTPPPSPRTSNDKEIEVAADSIDFSFIFFSSHRKEPIDNKYGYVHAIAEYADANGFKAVWVPERHFFEFGGIFPNPAMLLSNLAATTRSIRLRAGSVVLPLHHPASVVEAWSMLDNLSSGRVDMAFASGWNPNDFVLSRDTFGTARETWFERMVQVERLWEGKAVEFYNGKQELVPIKIYPQPVQPRLNVWMAITGNPDSFVEAGKRGYNVLTMMQSKPVEELAANIARYRKARADHGLDPRGGIVSLMLHTYVHDDPARVDACVNEHYFDYIKSGLKGHIQAMDPRPTEAEINKIVEHSFHFQRKHSALFGDVNHCRALVEKLRGIGVNEIACLVDFGISEAQMLETLPYINELKNVTGSPGGHTPRTKSIPKPTFKAEISTTDNKLQEFAIVGMAGRYPGAKSAEAFWDNLVANKNCIGEIDLDRYDWREHWGDPKTEVGKTNIRHFGLIEDIYRFDADFFGISRREAEVMDPHARLLLETTWQCIENAGYAPSGLKQSRTGVFVSFYNTDYNHLVESLEVDRSSAAYLGTALGGAIKANRISFLLGLAGPSETYDTACSSALVALHRAMQSITLGDCDQALVAGVSLLLMPGRVIALSKLGLLNESGLCNPFSFPPNKEVIGEGVGALLIKPLGRAIADKDYIYAVIGGSDVSHQGSASGSLTMPSADSLAKLMQTTYRKTGVVPEQVTYIEGHGSGNDTDLVELLAFQKCFANAPHLHKVHVGSVKSNIGFGEGSGGIAQIAKCALSLDHGVVPATLNFERTDPGIAIDPSRLAIQTTNRELPQDAVRHYMSVLAYGLGGTNAHIVLRSHAPVASHEYDATAPTTRHPVLLSASSESVLVAYASALHAHLSRESVQRNLRRLCGSESEVLEAISRTLLARERHASNRIALLVASYDELLTGLSSIAAGGVRVGSLWGSSSLTSASVDRFAASWVKGAPLTEPALHSPYQRIALPTVPFAGPELRLKRRSRTPGTKRVLHPLLHENTSKAFDTGFTSEFTGTEAFLADHRVNGTKVLPGVAHLEMAREAIQRTLGGDHFDTSIELSNVVWLRPVAVTGSSLSLRIAVVSKSATEVEFDIRDVAGQVYSQGRGRLIASRSQPRVDVEHLRSMCRQSSMTHEEIYSIFDAAGQHYGPSHRALVNIDRGIAERRPFALAELQRPACENVELFVLPPGLLDSALQAMLGLRAEPSSSQRTLHVPFALESIAIYSKLPAKAFAWVRTSDGSAPSDVVQKLDISVCDAEGVVCADLKGFSSRLMQESGGEVARSDAILMTPTWEAEAVAAKMTQPPAAHRVVLLGAVDPQPLRAILPASTSLDFISTAAGSLSGLYEEAAAKVVASVRELAAWDTNALLQVVIQESATRNRCFAGLSGLLKSAHREHPRLAVQCIEVDEPTAPGALARIIEMNARQPQAQDIRYRAGVRETKRLRKLSLDQNPSVESAVRTQWSADSIVLITGGAGGLGLIIAKRIVEQSRGAKVILAGRSALTSDKNEQIEALRRAGATVEYRRTDIADFASVRTLLANIRAIHGEVTSIIHCAGVVDEARAVTDLEHAAFDAVFAPKVAGLINLDEASRALPLQHFVCFSSLASAMGQPGLAGYAAANGFMDAYVQYRNGLVNDGRRRGHSIAINWPLWAEGGMRAGAEAESQMRQSGVRPLATDSGLAAFDRCLQLAQDQVVVLNGVRQKSAAAPSVVASAPVSAVRVDEALLQKVLKTLIQQVSAFLKVDATEIEVGTELSAYGFDSIGLTELINQLNQRFALNLSPTLFFEYSTLESFAAYLCREFAIELSRALNLRVATSVPRASAEADGQIERRHIAIAPSNVVTERVGNEAIAIIGVSGCFPGAADLESFWENLQAGRDSIGEIPSSRWDWQAIYGDPARETNKTNIKWGGFIDSVDQFDPLFFGISPKEAELMDPQQRLLMQYTWRAIEDAGYAPSSLSGSRTGIFVGTVSGGYNEIIAQANVPIEAYSSTGVVSSVGPNRVSYLLNLHGPSEPIETACSSSLVAIHRAVRAMQTGDCEQALVGGINTIISPWAHISFSKAGMLSEDGRCKTFSKDANGYVRGEGVGILFLKPLSKAQRDGDHIYGLIRGSAENHGGRANSLTAPNPKAQAELIKAAYTEAGIDPTSVTYIEAHGTGTPLGDPIEINGLKLAFADLLSAKAANQPPPFCGIGSVKTNIGHLELAAGVVGVIKVLLQLKHRTLVKSLHCAEVNPYIDLQGTPFYLVGETQPWPTRTASDGQVVPRRAGVSSFGFGGVNAHVLIEEYCEPRRADDVAADQPVIVVLSAKNDERLREQTQQLLAHVEKQVRTASDLADLAYTLQVGREAMEQRLALIVSSRDELVQKLRACLDAKALKSGIDDCYRGEVKANKEAASLFTADEDLQTAIGRWFEKGKYTKLLELWVKGVALDWNRLYVEGAVFGALQPRRVSLPTYPFARERYWVEGAAASLPNVQAAEVSHAVEAQPPVKTEGANEVAAPAIVDDASVSEKTLQLLKAMFSSVSKLSVEKIDAEEDLESYGIDSFMVVQMNDKLGAVFDGLSKTELFEYRSLRRLCDFLLSEHRARCVQWSGLATPAPATPVQATRAREAVAVRPERRHPESPHAPQRLTATERAPVESTDVAIIGVSGRYPHAATLDEYWDNLKSGRDCVGEIPSERWSLEGFFEPDVERAIAEGKSYGKWGGFLEGFAEFDPLFFNIPPREAQNIDPQERLFLTSCWEVLEDAGYTRQSLQTQHQGRVGVFAGITKTGFDLYGPMLWAQGKDGFPMTSFCSLANRVSYVLNLNGPSIPIDTMCSASLTALHEACEHLNRGECELAIAGGVNLYLHPSNYTLLAAQRMLSIDGRCKSFGNGGNGYVPGEGVGAVLLKPLHKAQRDGDHIYAVVKGTAINHGGKTNGYTVPNPNAQAELIGRAIAKAKLDPRAITYIEAHGTGTSLGDPIEITGLRKAFNQGRDTPLIQTCAIGSAKSNMGHLEAAAGIAGVTKVLLQMKHKQLVPSLHSQILNPNIDFARTPFNVQQTLTTWQQPIVSVDGQAQSHPRTAGISSFGAGGSNAHVIIQEYAGAEDPNRLTIAPKHPAIIVLSARSEAQLAAQGRNLLSHIERNALTDAELASIAYTLQVGREAMDERLAFTVSSAAELKEKLAQFAESKVIASNAYRGSAKQNRDAISQFAANADMRADLEAAIAQGQFEKLLDLWVKGLAFDWQRLYGEGGASAARPQRISLPTYPFAKTRYWIDVATTTAAETKAVSAGQLHPLIHQNTSTGFETKFSSTFDGEEFFFKDHQVRNTKVMPGVGHLEMARVAIDQAFEVTSQNAGDRAIELRNIVWLRPLLLATDRLTVHVGVTPSSETEAEIDIYSVDAADEETLYSQARGHVLPATRVTDVDLLQLKSICTQATLAPAEIYAAFAAIGMQYGPGHQAIVELKAGVDDYQRPQVLATLRMPNATGEFNLHPGVLDSALQAGIGLAVVDPARVSGTPLPFALASITIHQRLPESAYAWVRYSDGSQPGDAVQKLDITVCDEQGRVCADLKGFSSRMLRPEEANVAPTDSTLLWRSQWQPAAMQVTQSAIPVSSQRVFLVGSFTTQQYEAIKAALPGTVMCEQIGADGISLATRYTQTTQALFSRLQQVISDQPREPLLIQVVVHPGDRCFAGLSGLLKTASQESRKVVTQCIELSDDIDASTLSDILRADAADPTSQEIRYCNGERAVKRLEEVTAIAADDASSVETPWKNNGIYLITGGLGGLGLILARDIASHTRGATVILTGRSTVDVSTHPSIAELTAKGLKVDYRCVDVASLICVQELFAQIRNVYGRLTGIVHSAGVVHDNFIVKKTADELGRVLSPKVAGLANLDDASEDMPLDDFICFSSIAAVFGNPGQADYAAANGFMDAFARHRNHLVAQGRRHGKTLSINWPLWDEGGMQVDAAVRTQMRRQGLATMTTQSGLKALARGVLTGADQVTVLSGEPTRIRGLLTAVPKVAEAPKQKSAADAVDSGALLEKVQQLLLQQVSNQLGISADDLDLDTELSEYGFDSISLTEFGNRLDERFQVSLSPTIFFEYPTLGSFAKYLAGEHGARLSEALNLRSPQTVTAAAEVTEESVAAPPPAAATRRRRKLKVGNPTSASARERGHDNEPIAIVGISGCFPHANDVETFWANLLQGKDCITEIPPNRWDWRAVYGDPQTQANKTNVKWGGFIEGVDEFDPLFFNISPKEAELMDPQQRLLMTHTWRAIEDAGYAPTSLSGSRTGIFVGTANTGYSELIAQANVAIDGYSSTGIVSSVGPNRMSFLLNLHGPSEPIETACSSSLVAMHRAVRAIHSDDCEQALVGGINTIVTPWAHISFSKAGMLSEDGRCKTFSKNANGYVRGEGVGMLFLKKLSAAQRDGDHIYGVIRGSSENHGGRANSLTAPNPKAQAELIKSAYREAGIDARSVSYIEAHGTGTPLGDPIEINGLKSAFADLYADHASEISDAQCGIGSVKTNIGHLELAAGVAGVIKVLMQFKHRTLAPSLHCEEVNPYIQLQDSPFYLVREAQPWRAIKDSNGQELPRRAGVSSFGFGGVNAHVLLEEYRATETQSPPENYLALIVLSAKNEARLQAQVTQLLEHVSAQPLRDADLVDLAYTLQVGREAMEHRLAFTASSIDALKAKLAAYAAGKNDIDECYRGEVKKNKEAMAALSGDAEFKETIEKWMQRGKYAKLLELWSKGLAIEWTKLYATARPKRLSLPTYPFARERHWIEAASGALSNVVTRVLHPLLQENTSDLDTQRYSSTFSGAEFYLSDHVVQGRKVLPGVCYLEMARAAVANSTSSQSVALKNVVWLQPLAVNEDARVHIALTRTQSGDIEFEIFSASGDDEVVHAQGRAVSRGELPSEPPSESLDLTTLSTRCDRSISVETCYAAFTSMGLEYGSAHRGLSSVQVGSDEAGQRFVLAQVQLPVCVSETQSQYVLHPSVLDSALQASIGLSLDQVANTESADPSLPFALERLDIFDRTASLAWVHVRVRSNGASSGLQKLDIDLSDEGGRICARLSGFTSRVMTAQASLPKLQRAKAARPSVAVDVESSLLDKIQDALIMLVAQQMKVKPEEIDVDAELSEFGFDSIGLTAFSNTLNQIYGLELSPTIFFEHPTVSSFANHLAQEQAQLLAQHFSVGQASQPTAQTPVPAATTSVAPLSGRRPRSRHRSIASTSERSEPIAIVGVSGCFPDAPDVDAFWRNLLSGKDCITEIPADRWDWRAVYGDPQTQANKTHVKWGGFIDGIAEFDPLFFNISPKEAELMDPQQRLLMTYTWRAIEDAGYAPASLSGSRTGIFVGTASTGYSELIVKANLPIDGYSSTGLVASVGPNRMSYLLNLHGPSEPIETACSSSLVAIHRAVRAIHSGDCEQALVGGINTIVTPGVHISFSKAGMLSEDGRCKTFSKDANGYARGEGVGMLFLKKLSAAQRDGDHIYALIRGSSENHGGRANSLTAPNPKAQAELIKAAYREAQIDPSSVSYIEAHGTGTPLGDPVEINGLKNAFAELYAEHACEMQPGRCGLGSVKTNIGHLELAAGVAGVIKVLMQLKHRTLAPSLHCADVNPYIQLHDSPFYLVKEPQLWRALRDERGDELPRRAGVSSFGFGGVNAHVVLEEYRGAQDSADAVAIAPEQPALIVLSARTEEGLKEQVQQLLAHLTSLSNADVDLASLAYTLQVGRDAMDHRLAFKVTSIEELKQTLKVCECDLKSAAHRGKVKKNKDALAALTANATEEAIDTWLQGREHDKLLDLWVKGLSFDWTQLYAKGSMYAAPPKRMSLPTYPFARDRYWIEADAPRAASLEEGDDAAAHDELDDALVERMFDSFLRDECSVAEFVSKLRIELTD